MSFNTEETRIEAYKEIEEQLKLVNECLNKSDTATAKARIEYILRTYFGGE